MLIVEGMDNTGKSTLVKHLTKSFKQLTLRDSPSNLRGTDRLVEWLDEELVRQGTELCIYDRFPLISEEVYGPILRGKSVIPKGRYDGWAEEHQVLFIYCRPNNSRIEEWGDREQMDGVVRHTKELLQRYDEVIYNYRHKGWGVVKYDYAGLESYNKVRIAVKNYVEEFRW